MTPSAKEGSYQSQSLPGRNPKTVTLQAIALSGRGGVIDGQDAAIAAQGGEAEADARLGRLDGGVGHLLDMLDAGARRQRTPEVIDPVAGLDSERPGGHFA